MTNRSRVVDKNVTLDCSRVSRRLGRRLGETLLRGLSIAATLLITASASAAEVDVMVGAPQGPWRRLLLDDTHITEQQKLKRVFHRAKKYAKNPVVPKTRPWEGNGPYVHGTVMHDQGKLRMWYLNYHHDTSRYMGAYAESRADNGLNWTKPGLGLHPFRDTKDTNLMLIVGNSDEKSERKAHAGNLSVINRPWIADASKRYIAFFIIVTYNRATATARPGFATSPDGIHWKIGSTPLKGLRSADEFRVCYDPYRQQYVAACKVGDDLRGRTVTVAVSPDGLTWRYVNGDANEPVVYTLETGKQANQIYDMPVFPYQGLCIGLPNVYHAGWPSEAETPTTLDVEIAWSRNLKKWHRPPNAGQGKNTLIALGERDAFDRGAIMSAANAPVVMGDELWFYYGGWTGPHRDVTRPSAIGLATLRLDGFVSMDAGDEEGTLVTQLEEFTGATVTINAKVKPGGSIQAELIDADGHVVPGFERDRCLPFKGDSVRHRLTWRDATKKHLQPARKVKIRFYLHKASLFAYVPTDSDFNPTALPTLP